MIDVKNLLTPYKARKQSGIRARIITTTKERNRPVIMMLISIAVAALLIAGQSLNLASNYAYADKKQSQTSVPDNVCGNGTSPLDILCQNCELLIQGSGNAADLICHQNAPSQITPPSATLIVIKNLICSSEDPHGCDGITPSSFTIHVTGNNPSPSTFQGSGSGTTVTLGSGPYSVSEDPFPGNTPVFSADCTGTVSPGQTKTCTILNQVVS